MGVFSRIPQHLVGVVESLKCKSTSPVSPRDVPLEVESAGSQCASGNDGASQLQSTFNLTKNIIGSGVLCLPAGLAAGTGTAPAFLVALVLGSMSGYTYLTIARICNATGLDTFKGLGEATRSIALGKFIILICLLDVSTGLVAYTTLIADNFSLLAETLGLGISRTTVLFGMMAFVVAPLCLLGDLSKMSYTSLAGICGMLYTTIFIIIRCFDGTYALGGVYHNAQKEEHRVGWRHHQSHSAFSVNMRTLVLVAAFSTAFRCHYNAPNFYKGLRNRSVARFSQVIKISFAIGILEFALIMVAGYSTFGTNTQGNILLNYSTIDPLASVARAAVGLATVCAYPLVFNNLRGNFMELFGVHQRLFIPITFGFLAAIAIVAWLVPDLLFVSSFSGAFSGAISVYIIPSLLFLFAVSKRLVTTSQVEIWFFRFVVVAGCLLVLVGSMVCVLEEFFPAVLGDVPDASAA